MSTTEILSRQENYPLRVNGPTCLAEVDTHDLIKHNILIERVEKIELGRINLDESLIDENHAKLIGKSIAGIRGQLEPIVVRAREVEGNIVYDITNGFHRTKGKIINGDKEIEAKVMYGCTDEEMFDLRIMAAITVKSLQFAREIDWIKKAFALTKFAQEKKLTITQAFSITTSDSKRTNLAELTSTDLSELREWVGKKSSFWQKTTQSIYQDLLIADNSAPDLVKQVKVAAGGTSRAAYLTRDKLRVISKEFPGEKNHNIQRTIVGQVLENKYQLFQVENILKYIKTINPNETDPQILIEIIKQIPQDILNRKTQTASNEQLIKLYEENEKLRLANIKLSHELADEKMKKTDPEVLKKMRHHLSSWIKNPDISLTPKEQMLAFYFLYSRNGDDIISTIKEKNPRYNYLEIISLLKSMFKKKLNYAIDIYDSKKHPPKMD